MSPPDEAPGPIRRATFYCDTCQRETPHRLLRIDRHGPAGTVSGIARCQECRSTGPFASSGGRSATFEAIVSEGPRSTRLPVELPATRQLAAGDLLDIAGSPARLTKLEDRRHRAVKSARAEEISTVWATRATEATVRVALMEGARSRTVRVPASVVPAFEVGAVFRLGPTPLVIAALRARGHTWRRPGDAFPSDQVSVVYARRAVIPPAGRRRWSSEREIPSSRASSSSRRGRSRSSPGPNR